LESQADNNARAYFFPAETTSDLVMMNIQRSRKSRLIIKLVIGIFKSIQMKLEKCRNISAMLNIIPIHDTATPYGFRPNKLYVKPKFAFSSAIRGNFVQSLVLDINQVTADEA
jgi:hypothetical protein